MTFEKDKTYPSAVVGRHYRVTMKFRVQDTDCLLVYLSHIGVMFGMTSRYYPAIIEPDGKTATVLLDDGFTTIYDEAIEGTIE